MSWEDSCVDLFFLENVAIQFSVGSLLPRYLSFNAFSPFTSHCGHNSQLLSKNYDIFLPLIKILPTFNCRLLFFNNCKQWWLLFSHSMINHIWLIFNQKRPIFFWQNLKILAIVTWCILKRICLVKTPSHFCGSPSFHSDNFF